MIPALAEGIKPNIVVIYEDDGRTPDLGEIAAIQAMIGDAGATFTRNYVSLAICGPSRATAMTGQYAHNHRIRGNTPPMGGYTVFRDQDNPMTGKPLQDETLPVWMRRAGYFTYHMGKYTNGYTEATAGEIPPGWDRWFTVLSTHESGRHSDQGRVVDTPGNTARIYGSRADTFIRNRGEIAAPYLLWIGVNAPHTPPEVEPQYADDLAGKTAPRTLNFNEEDVSDKPGYIRRLARLSAAQVDQVDEIHRDRLRAQLSVRDMIQKILIALSETGQLANTYVIFTSDNGYHLGNHRLMQGKLTPYEEDISVPLLVRGPGIAPGTVRSQLAANHDLAPTICGLGGAEVPPWVDGRSLEPLLFGSPPANWRTAVGLESWYIDTPIAAVPDTPTNHGVRSANRMFVRYDTGEAEFYLTDTDPRELDNRAGDFPEAQRRHQEQANGIYASSGAACRTWEGA